MWLALVTAALAADPLELTDVESIPDVPVVYAPVTDVTFDHALDVNAHVEGPSIAVTTVVNPKWEGSFIRLRDTFDVEISRSVRAMH